MASYNANININVNTGRLEGLDRKLERVQSIIDAINLTPIAIDDGRASERVKEAAAELQNFAKKQAEVQTVSYTTTNALRDQANTYRLIAGNAKIGGELFRNATIASERLSRRAATADMERLAVLKELYTTQTRTINNKQVVGNFGIEELIRQQKIAFGANSIAALEAYKSELESVYELMGADVPGRTQVLDLLSDAEKKLAAIQRPAQSKGKPVKAGPSVELYSPQYYMLRQKYADDLLATERKIQRIQVNLNDSAMSQNDRAAVRNRLAEAEQAILKNNLSLASKLAIESDRYLRDAKARQASLERLQRLETEKPLAVKLGGGQEAAARDKYMREQRRLAESSSGAYIGNKQLDQELSYQSKIKAVQAQRVTLSTVIQQQQQRLNIILKDYEIAQKKGASVAEEKSKLAELLKNIEAQRLGINEENSRILANNIQYYRLALEYEIKIARAAGTYRNTGSSKVRKTPEQVAEEMRNRILSNALGVESSLITLQGKGASVADQRLQIEKQILQLKKLQNNASMADLQIIAMEVKELRNKSKEIANTVAGGSTRKIPFLERRFGKEKASAISEGLVGGSFPLLFGQGLGASIGGLVGGAAGGFLGNGLGFGLSLAGTSIGAFLDQSVIKAKELGNAIQIASDNYGVLREKGLDFSSDLDRQVRLMKEQGKYVDAQQKMRDAVSLQTGDINALSTRGTTAAVNSLEKAWRDVSAALGVILGTLATPIMFALVLIAKIVQGIAATVNLIVTGLGFLVNLIPGIAKFSEFASEQALRGTKAYEDQLAEIDKQIDANVKLNKIATDKNNLISQAIGKSRVEYDIAVKKAEAEERRAKLQKEIEEFRASAPTGTPELRARAGIGEMQIRQRFFQEELGMVLSNAQQLFNEITDNNRRIAQQQRQYELEYADMVRQNRIAQQDLDLEAARKVQDIRIEMREKELQYTKQIADQELKAIRLADEERSFRRGINAAISGNPDDDVINTVETAIEKWRTGRREVEQEYAAKQQEIQLQAQKAEIALQRYKYDNALKIARANEESQIKISKMQEQINIQNLEAERGRLEYRLNSLYAETQLLEANLKDRQRELDLLIGKVSTGVATANAYGQMLLKTEQQYIDSQMRLVSDLRAKIDRVADMPAARLSPIGPAPMLTDPSASASAAMGDAAAQVRRYEEQLALLQKISGINKNDLELAKDLLAPGEQGLRQLNEALALQKRQIESRRIYNYLIDRGASREFAEENVRVIETYSALTAKIDALVKSIMSKKEYTEPGSKLPGIVNDLNAMSSGARVKSQTLLTGIAERYSPQQRVADEVGRIQEELNKLVDGANQVISAANAIGDAFSTSFKGIISGSMTAQEALASFFKNVAEHFLDMAAQIITKMIIIKILNAATSLLPVSNVASLGPVATAAGVVPRAGFMGPAFADGGMFANGIQPFAMGGIVSSPTLFKFAQGGVMRTGLMGEAEPEGILPLSRGPGGRLGVDASGIGDNGGVNVTVNVDATGSKVQGDSGRAGELGRAISAAVQQELIKQKRNGGLLA